MLLNNIGSHYRTAFELTVAVLTVIFVLTGLAMVFILSLLGLIFYNRRQRIIRVSAAHCISTTRR